MPAVAALLLVLPAWHETRPSDAAAQGVSVPRILGSPAFRTYTLGFGAAMGAFFVFFSTAPRVLIDGAGFSGPGFGIAFATVALVMIATARSAKRLVGRWCTAGSLARGIALASSVTTNGALAEFGGRAGTAVALHFCIQSLIVGVVGTLAAALLDGGTAWPLAAYAAGMGGLTLAALRHLHGRVAAEPPA